jgi:guanylate kinase
MSKLFIITGPSATGKTTMANLICHKNQNILKIKTCTTRLSRGGGDDYNFLEKGDFIQKIESGKFLEHEEVYPGVFYGVLESDIRDALESNRIPLLVMDVKGAFKIKELMGGDCEVIFISPKSIEEIKSRLLSRGTDSNIESRMDKIDYEMAFQSRADLVVENRDVWETYTKIDNWISKVYEGNKLGGALVVNLFAPPGVGKSTTAAGIFWYLKTKGINCELVTEYAKDKVWERSFKTLEDQLYLLGKQNYRMFRLRDQVDVIITDSPLLMQKYYIKDDPKLRDLVGHQFNKYNNINFFIERDGEYSTKGRTQTKEESMEMGSKIMDIIVESGIQFYTIKIGPESHIEISNKILENLKDGKE